MQALLEELRLAHESVSPLMQALLEELRLARESRAGRQGRGRDG
jgi:hypothetical protein